MLCSVLHMLSVRRAFHTGSLETQAYPAGRKPFQRDTVPLSLAIEPLRHGLQEIAVFPGVSHWEENTRVLGVGLGELGDNTCFLERVFSQF